MVDDKPTQSIAVQDSQARLLVVDDDPRLVASLCPLLKNNGFEVDSALSARAACQQAKRIGYDLILLDMRMPEVSGLQLMAQLNKAELDVPIVVVSGETSFSTVRKALRGGAFDYIRKPYNIDSLVTTVRAALRKHRQRKAQEALAMCARASEELHRRAVNNLPDIVFTVDSNGRFCFLNDRVENLLGYTAAELIGQPFPKLMHARDVVRVSATFTSPEVSFDSPATLELRLRTRDSKMANRDFEITVFPLEGDSLGNTDLTPPCFPAHYFGIARDITESKESQAFISFQASHDLLTRLPNRTLFRDRLVLAIAHATRDRQKLAVMFLDLNRFKAVNDNLGHSVGDRLLKQIADRLKSCLRAGDTLSRFGGDEFTLLLPAMSEEADARVIADKLIQSLKPSFRIGEHEVQVGVSIGIAMFPENGTTMTTLIEHADAAMYRVKRQGGDGYLFHSWSQASGDE